MFLLSNLIYTFTVLGGRNTMWYQAITFLKGNHFFSLKVLLEICKNTNGTANLLYVLEQAHILPVKRRTRSIIWQPTATVHGLQETKSVWPSSHGPHVQLRYKALGAGQLF